uniref:Secreted protein n=1 Tax=Steinernema glaseri TaxID=37863 RepID=A0A1I7YLU8_9BILA
MTLIDPLTHKKSSWNVDVVPVLGRLIGGSHLCILLCAATFVVSVVLPPCPFYDQSARRPVYGKGDGQRHPFWSSVPFVADICISIDQGNSQKMKMAKWFECADANYHCIVHE